MMWGLDPRVTLASLAHPGLNSVAAPRLIELFTATYDKVTQDVLMERDCFADIGQRLVPVLSLVHASGKARYFSNQIPIFSGI